MLTTTPSNSMSSYGCGFCGISSQVPVQVYDPDTGSAVLDDEGAPILVNDEPAASSEMEGHLVYWHPVLIDDNGNDELDSNGMPRRENVGVLP